MMWGEWTGNVNGLLNLFLLIIFCQWTKTILSNTKNSSTLKMTFSSTSKKPPTNAAHQRHSSSSGPRSITVHIIVMCEKQKESDNFCCYWLVVLHKRMRIKIHWEVREAQTFIQICINLVSLKSDQYPRTRSDSCELWRRRLMGSS